MTRCSTRSAGDCEACASRVTRRHAVVATLLGAAFALPTRAQMFWQEASLQNTTDKPVSAALGDLDRDGHLDLVIAGQSPFVPGVISIRWGGPYGFQFGDTCQLSFASLGRVYVQDLSGDGWPEIVVANGTHTTVTVFVNGGPQAGNCPILFTPMTLPSNQGVELLRFADIDGDSKLDIVMAGGGGHSLHYQPQTAASPVGGVPQFAAGVDVSQAAGANAQPPQTSFSYGFAKGLGVGDFDGDGTPDVVVGASSSIGAGIHVYYNRPTGWEYQSFYANPSGKALGVAVGDFNADGLTDFAASFATRDIVTFLNSGPPLAGVYADVIDFPSIGVGLDCAPLLSGDYDTDGDIDLAYGDPLSGTVAITFNTGSGIFAVVDQVHYPMSILGAKALVDGDIDGDADLDFVSAIYTTASMQCLFNQKSPNARRPVHARRLRGGAFNAALSDFAVPDGAPLSQDSSNAPLHPSLGGYLWADKFGFQTQGAAGTRIRVRIHDWTSGLNGTARVGLRDVNTQQLVWVAQYSPQSVLAENVLDIPNANRFGAGQGWVELVLLHASAQASFQSSVDQLSLELIP